MAKRDGGKQPFFIHPKDQEVFSLAGIWEIWHHSNRIWRTFSILTTTPNKEMKAIHDRMPVILHQDDEAQWLHADSENAIAALLQPYPDNGLAMYEVSIDVNTARANGRTLVGPRNST